MNSVKHIFFAFVISFVALNESSALVCTYEYNNVEYACNVTENSLSCDFNYGNNISAESVNVSNLNMSLNYTDFIDENGKVDCNQVKNLYFDQNINKISVQIIYDIRKDNNSCPIHEQRYNAKPSDFLLETEGCITYSLISQTTPQNPTGGASAQDPSDIVFSEETFCKGSVQGVFTTLGWIFFILKILIPIILIVFGSIDFAKAVLSSKDDEIKKSAKSLVMRAIAGIIIFFIPTILGFIISIFDKTNAYNGTFGDCTKCMLNPMHEFDDGTVCRKLIGD